MGLPPANTADHMLHQLRGAAVLIRATFPEAQLSRPIASLSLKEEAESRFPLLFLTILLNGIGVNSINLITWKTGH